jgi:hypothetical protein
MTNQKLLKHLASCKNLYLDSKYKLIDLEYPVIVLDVTYVKQAFVVVELAVVPEDSAYSFKYVIQALIDQAELNGIDFFPRNIVTDAAPR